MQANLMQKLLSRLVGGGLVFGAIVTSACAAEINLPTIPPPPPPPKPHFIPHFMPQDKMPLPTGGEAHLPDGQSYHGDIYPDGTTRGGYDNNGRGGSVEHGPGNTGGELHWTWHY
jgi:hypothetical protein